MTPEPGHARLPDAAQAALAGSAAEFIARQLDERARLERSAVAAAPAAGGHGSAEDRVPDAAPATAQVRWSWGPIAVMVVPLLILLAVTLA
jgi:hypothetical protein